MDYNLLCPNCMTENRSGSSKCPRCGYDKSQLGAQTLGPDGKPATQHVLKPFSILQGKYMIGNVMGEGGFGITYIALDMNLEVRIALKEFYPMGFVSRDSSQTTMVTTFTGSNENLYEKWRSGFVKEARSLAKLSDLEGVVKVRDFFQENNTAYIVMEYVEGQTLKDYLKAGGGRVAPQQALEMMRPVVKSLCSVHQAGIVHRDISPDNIMFRKDGSLKLIDFGAAREFDGGGERSLSVMLKPGYAPEEQYRTKGKQGPWTDVYALCATLYRCICGIKPPEAMERMRNDEIKTPSQLGIPLPAPVEMTLMKGLAVFAENRIKDMNTLYDGLYSGQNGQSPLMNRNDATVYMPQGAQQAAGVNGMSQGGVSQGNMGPGAYTGGGQMGARQTSMGQPSGMTGGVSGHSVSQHSMPQHSVSQHSMSMAGVSQRIPAQGGMTRGTVTGMAPQKKPFPLWAVFALAFAAALLIGGIFLAGLLFGSGEAESTSSGSRTDSSGALPADYDGSGKDENTDSGKEDADSGSDVQADGDTKDDSAVRSASGDWASILPGNWYDKDHLCLFFSEDGSGAMGQGGESIDMTYTLEGDSLSLSVEYRTMQPLTVDLSGCYTEKNGIRWLDLDGHYYSKYEGDGSGAEGVWRIDPQYGMSRVISDYGFYCSDILIENGYFRAVDNFYGEGGDLTSLFGPVRISTDRIEVDVAPDETVTMHYYKGDMGMLVSDTQGQEVLFVQCDPKYYYESTSKFLLEVSASDGFVNLRTGPGTEYEIIRAITNGQRLTVYGANPDGRWFIVDYGGQLGWVAASQVTVVSAW